MLSERVEALTGPDREVDREIRQSFGHAWDYAADWDRLNTSTGVKESNPVAMPYTASLDAAMTLVPDGAGVALFRAKVGGASRCELENSDGHEFCVDAESPALALTAAALRSRGL